MSKSLILRPRLSEKTYNLSEGQVYVVDIPKDANKHTVARAVETQFEVKVDKVNIANIKGKSKQVMSITGKRRANTRGRQTDVKKAYIKLAEGNSLPFFAAIEEEEQKEQKIQEQVDKAATKQAAKEAKKEVKEEAKEPAKKADKPTEAGKPAKAEKPKTAKTEKTEKKKEAVVEPEKPSWRRRFFLRGRKGKADE